MNMWIWLSLAIAFEVAGTMSLKASYGFSKLTPSVLTFICYAISFIALSFTLKKIDVGIAYAIWAGVGTAIVAAGGSLFFGEAISLIKIISIVMIISGVVLLNLYGQAH